MIVLRTRRAASSLIEVMIAMAIFAVVITAIMDLLASTRGLDAMNSAHDDLTLDGDRIFAEMAKDLSASGWLYPPSTAATYPLDVAPQVLPNNITGDRAARYFPYVQQQRAVGSAFPHTRHSSWDLDAYRLAQVAPNLPGTAADASTSFGQAAAAAYRASFFAPSQELVFVRIVGDGGWYADPLKGEPPTIDFSGSIANWQDPYHHWTVGDPLRKPLYPSAWIETRDGSGNITGYKLRPEVDANANNQPDFPYGVPLRSARINDLASDPSLERVWETMAAPNYFWRKGTFSDAEGIRDYEYAVVASRVGLGRLVRAFREPVSAGSRVSGVDVGQWISSDGSTRMVVQRVLSDDVVRIVCDTCRSESPAGPGPSLDVNDVRVRLYLARRASAEPHTVIFRIVETVFSMRAKASETDRKGDDTYVMPKPPGSVYLNF